MKSRQERQVVTKESTGQDSKRSDLATGVVAGRCNEDFIQRQTVVVT